MESSHYLLARDGVDHRGRHAVAEDNHVVPAAQWVQIKGPGPKQHLSALRCVVCPPFDLRGALGPLGEHARLIVKVRPIGYIGAQPNVLGKDLRRRVFRCQETKMKIGRERRRKRLPEAALTGMRSQVSVVTNISFQMKRFLMFKTGEGTQGAPI